MQFRLQTASAVLLAVATNLAQANLLTNGSFESGAFAPPSNQTMSLAPGSTALSGWQIVNDSLAWIGVGDPWGLDAQDGNLFLDLSDYSAGAPFGGIQQTFATTPGYKYTTTFHLGSSTRWGRPAALTASAAGQSATFTSATVGTNNDWQQFSFVFVASSTATTLSFVGSSGVNYIGLDNVITTVSAVPEPASYALMMAGITVLGLAARRRRAR